VQHDRYAVVDDVGTVINPIGLKGQIHGGVAQGVGQILMEQVVWDNESGQLLTASFLDYAMPRADTLTNVTIESNPVPTRYNPLGAKGAGEAGTVGDPNRGTISYVSSVARALLGKQVGEVVRVGQSDIELVAIA
jgi:CO/xanthine dehydrogenase Mo-binding subunit